MTEQRTLHCELMSPSKRIRDQLAATLLSSAQEKWLTGCGVFLVCVTQNLRNMLLYSERLSSPESRHPTRKSAGSSTHDSHSTRFFPRN